MLAHEGTPFTLLYEHMTPDALPRVTHDRNAGRYVSCRSCSDTIASKPWRETLKSNFGHKSLIPRFNQLGRKGNLKVEALRSE